jgi:hypothetical protein
MGLLFKREQTTGKIGRVAFKLWGKSNSMKTNGKLGKLGSEHN